MAFNTVIMHYGPCESFHTTIHKPQKIRGLRDRLQKLGFRVDLVPVEFVNYCMLEMCGHEVFRCNIQQLKFNTPYYLDPVCQRAIEAVVESSVKLQRARRYLLFWRMIDRELFRRTQFTPKDYWPPIDYCPPKDKLEDCHSCFKCQRCCNVSALRKS